MVGLDDLEGLSLYGCSVTSDSLAGAYAPAATGLCSYQLVFKMPQFC